MSWRLPLSIQCAIGIILAIGALFIPESPRHLIATGQDEDGLRVIAALHGLDEDDALVLAEFKEIQEVVEADVSRTLVWEKSGGRVDELTFDSFYRTQLEIEATLRFGEDTRVEF